MLGDLLHGYAGNLSYGEPDHWADRANCRGLAYELFEYQEADSPLVKDMTYEERLAFNAANFELAAEVCIECPVFFQCKEAANKDDLRWTVRAGEEPTRFFHEKRMGEGGKGNGGDKWGGGVGRTCRRGHEVPKGGRCWTCKRQSRVARDRRVRAEKPK